MSRHFLAEVVFGQAPVEDRGGAWAKNTLKAALTDPDAIGQLRGWPVGRGCGFAPQYFVLSYASAFATWR